MRLVLNPKKNAGINGRTDNTRTKLTETTLITPTNIHKNKTKHKTKVQQNVYLF